MPFLIKHLENSDILNWAKKGSLKLNQISEDENVFTVLESRWTGGTYILYLNN